MFVFKDLENTQIYTYCNTRSLHDALPICDLVGQQHPVRLRDLDVAGGHHQPVGLVVGQLIGSDQRRNILQRLKIDVLCRNRSPCDGNGPEDCSSQSCRSPQSPPFHSLTIRPPSEATSQRPASATPPLESRRPARPEWYLKDRSQTRSWRENTKESRSA